jgi:CubicO group peptidase (beta-lactamase class C family)
VAALGIAAVPRRALALEHGPVDELLKARLAEQGVGFVALQIDGSRVDVAAQGVAREGVPLRDDALFEIGSITKTFTALLLADAVLRKRLALDDPIENALPGVTLRDAAGMPIRWIDVATHRSGLPRLPTNMAPKDPADPYADYDEAKLLDFLRSYKTTTVRDTRWEYSNLGFGLLGYALARVDDTTYPRLLAQRVLGPLGMTRTSLALPGRAIEGLVDGHDANGRPVPHWHLDVLMGAGALVMPAADLARYAKAALTPTSTPLGEAFTLAESEHGAGPSAMNPIGLAWIRAPLNGRTVLTHDGGTAGFSSSMWLDPQRQRASAVLANAMVEVNDLALHLLDESVPLKNLGLMRQAAITVPAEQLAPLVGVYALNPQFKLTISIRDGAVWAQATGQGAFLLFANEPRRFFAKVTPLEIEFADGSPPASLTLRQGGQILRFNRE